MEIEGYRVKGRFLNYLVANNYSGIPIDSCSMRNPKRVGSGSYDIYRDALGDGSVDFLLVSELEHR